MSVFHRCMIALYLLVLIPARATAHKPTGEATALRQAVAAERARPRAPRVPLAAFLSHPAVSAVTLSPDGRFVAYLQTHGHDHALWLMPTDGEPARRLLSDTDARQLSFTHDGHRLLLKTPRQVFSLALDGHHTSGIVTTLGGPDAREMLGVDPRRPAAVIVREQVPDTQRNGTRWRLLRIDMRGHRTVLYTSSRRMIDFAFDATGRLRFLAYVDGGSVVIAHRDATGRWRDLRRCAHLQFFRFLSASADGRALLMLGNLGGDLKRLERLDADGHLHTVQRDPRGEADLAWVALDPRSRQPLAVGYRSTRPAHYGLTPAIKQQFAHLDNLLPGRDLRVWVGRGVHARWLVSARSSRVQGRHWYLYQPQMRQLHRILELPRLDRDRKPIRAIAETVTARKIAFAWHASDGMRLQGFLSLPPGTDPAQLPLLVLVHGGPCSHARPGFSAYVQLLANRGYAVFEPNFRGSTGLGRQYMFAANGDFGNGRVQQDIVDGVHYLLNQHIGNPDRVGIAGASFGGYSTLLGLTWQPQLFKVGVAIVPPPDFAWVIRWMLRSREALALSPTIPMRDWMHAVDLAPGDRAHMQKLHAQSPLSNASHMSRPLLMIAGARDRRVALRSVIEYTAKLQTLHKDISLLVDPNAGHVTDDDIAREAQGYLLLRMLHRHLGGAAPRAPAARIRSYIEHNLRVAGPGLGKIQ